MKAKNKPSILRESDLYELWNGLCRSRKSTTDNRLRGIDAGVLNLACGPDYRSAEFDLDGKRYRGDVEIHLRIADWFRHGHHLDWRYDNVLLHLVADQVNSVSENVTTSKGQYVPTLGFDQFPPLVCAENSVLNCHSHKDNLIDMEVCIERMALCRLAEKASLFQCAALGDGLDQAMYRALLRMLGRSQNSGNYERLGLMLPWSTISLVKKRWHPDGEQWLALLLYLGGLGGGMAERRFPAIPDVTDQPVLPADCWQVAGHWPNAHPKRRLSGLARFVHGFPQTELFYYFLEQTTPRKPFDRYLQQMQQVFLPASGEKFWGKNLVIELVGNVVIPGLLHYAELTGSAGFKSYLEDLYLWLPATSVYGSLKKYQTWPECRCLPKKFYIPQGLLWLQKNYCDKGLCDQCPLGRKTETN